MKLFKGGLVAALTAVVLLAGAGTASADLQAGGVALDAGDDVFGHGSLSTTGFGASSCSSVEIRGEVDDPRTGSPSGDGGTGTVTSLDDGGSCSGVLQAITLTSPWSLELTSTSAGTVDIPAVEVDTIFGTCEYSVTLSGSYASSTLTVSGTASLVSTISGFCTSSPSLAGSFHLDSDGTDATTPSDHADPDVTSV